MAVPRPPTSSSAAQIASIHKPWILLRPGVLINISALAHVESSGTTDIIFHSSAGDIGATVTYADATARDAALARIVTHLLGMAVYADVS